MGRRCIDEGVLELIFTYLEITDFMKIKDATFELSPTEMVVLQGGNGQGKSAVFEAMALILTGHRKSSSVKHYIRRGQPKFTLKAVIHKSPESEPYHIEMTCSHKTMPPMNKVVSYQGNMYQNSEYDTFMKSQFDIDLISNITLTMQGDNSISQFKPSQLRDLLKTVFKISFEKEQESVHGAAGHYRELTRTLTDKSNTLQDTLDILRRDEPILYRPPSQEKLTEKRVRVEKLSEDIT
ncbi:MAG: AAA family ATPase, partial [Actinobacteria bacterium]|nr:AAA family ATPase [Actinomycetota bacterium]